MFVTVAVTREAVEGADEDVVADVDVAEAVVEEVMNPSAAKATAGTAELFFEFAVESGFFAEGGCVSAALLLIAGPGG